MPELLDTLFSDANLVSYWRLEGNSTDSKDSNNGTDTAITYNASNGKFGQGAGFNGTTSKIALGNPANLKITGNFSFGAWFKTSTTGAYQVICASFSNNAASKEAGIQLLIWNDNKLNIASGKDTGGVENTDWKRAQHTANVTDGAWHLGVGVWNGSSLLIYVDDQGPVSVAWANAAAYEATSYCRIGDRVGSSTNEELFFNGSIDDVFIFDKALSAGEINNLYQERDTGGIFLQ